MNKRLTGRRLALFLPLVLLTGCGSDLPVEGPPPDQPRPYEADRPVAPDDPTPTDSGGGGTPDPLVGDAGEQKEDPLMRHDPMLANDPMEGRGMPTQHSHWLRGRLRNAQVTVLLNGVWYGSFSGTVDRDITMSLRRGTNTVTFECQPGTGGATGDLEVVESEHQPPISPLATFHIKAGSDAGLGTTTAEPVKPITQTSPFTAN